MLQDNGVSSEHHSQISVVLPNVSLRQPSGIKMDVRCLILKNCISNIESKFSDKVKMTLL